MLTLFLAIIDSKEQQDKFTLLYELYHKRLLAFAAKLVPKDDAEDAVQEAWLRIAKNIDRIEDPHSERTVGYIMTITRNCAYTVLKQEPKLYPGEREAERKDMDDILNELCEKERFEETVENIRRLNDMYRPVLYLYYVEECTVSQIASQLGRKKETVRKQLQRGREVLIGQLRKEEAI